MRNNKPKTRHAKKPNNLRDLLGPGIGFPHQITQQKQLVLIPFFRRFVGKRKRSPEEKRDRQNRQSIAPVVRDILSGEFLTKEGVTRHIPYLLFVSALFIAYIAMGYQFERIEREKLTTKRQLQELSAEFKTLKAEFETELQQSTVEQNIADLGLKQTIEPPFLLEYKPADP